MIVGLVVSLVSVTVGGNDAYRLHSEAKQFANNTSLISEEAVLTHQQWGVDIFRTTDSGIEQFGYRWLIRSDAGVWELVNAETMQAEFLFSPGISLRLQLEGGDEEIEIEYQQVIAEQRSIAEQRAIAEQEDSDEDGSMLRIIDEQGIVEEEAVEPELWLLSSGEISAFTLTLFDEANPDTEVTLEGDELGRIKVDTGAEDEEKY